MKFTRNMKDEFIVFYLQFINSLEGLGMFFSSAALIHRLRKYTATDSQSFDPKISSNMELNEEPQSSHLI